MNEYFIHSTLIYHNSMYIFDHVFERAIKRHIIGHYSEIVVGAGKNVWL